MTVLRMRPLDFRASNRKSVTAICDSCRSSVRVYDLACYPAAVKLAGDDVFGPMRNLPVQPTQLFVCYEYPEPEPDVEFDRNDISWCQIFADDGSGNLVEVFNDETA
jgi:hypothetical protein